MKLTRLSASIFVSLLFGCSEAPVYKAPDIPAPEQYKETTTIWQPAQPADDLSRGEWWKSYQDATLDSLVTRLDAANADLAAAVAHYDQATAYAEQAQAGLFPTLSAGSYMTRNQQSQTRALRSANQPNVYGDQALGLAANYEVDVWGRVRNLVQSGEAAQQAAAADLESVHLSLRAELANNYLALRILDAQAKQLVDANKAYATALELTQNRFHGGVSSELDVSRAKVQLETTQAKLSDTIATRALYEHAIATLVGESASGFTLAPDVVSLQVPNIPVNVPATLLQRRPDIAAAERRMAASNAQIGVVKSAFYPSINLAAAGGYESAKQTGWLNAPNLFWTIGPNVLFTIFDAGRRQAVVAQAEASFRVDGAKYRSTVLHAFQDVEDNLSLLNHLTEESVSLNAAVTDTQRTLDIAMNRYREGVASYLEVVTAQAVAEQVQLDELNLRKRRLQASVNLIRALGGGWDAASLSPQ
ncbi:MAG: efflux transporter outer membrane subunit [Gallionella sp.]